MIYIAQKLDEGGDYVCIETGTDALARAHCRSQGWFYLGAMGRKMRDDLERFRGFSFMQGNM